MQSVFPKRSAVLSASLTVALLGGLLWGMRESLLLLHRIQTVDIPLLELTAINLNLQNQVQIKLEVLVNSHQIETLEAYKELRVTMLDQLDEYKRALASANPALFAKKKFDRNTLTKLESEILTLVEIKNFSFALERLKSADFESANDQFRRPFQDVAEHLSELRDIRIDQSTQQMYFFFSGSLMTLLIIALMWSHVFRAYRLNLNQRKKLEGELELERAKSLESAKMVTLGEMAGGIAHEINNPLSIMLFTIERIKQGIETMDVDKEIISHNLRKLTLTSNRIAKIVRGLRFFSRDGENDPFQKCQLNLIIEDTVELLRGKCKDNGVQLRLHEDQYQVELECRAVQISQVILNTISNSVDAVQNLPHRWIDITVQKKEAKLQIRITDSGNGIPTALLDKIFNPFFTTKRVGEGTGLGLSISFGIIKSHSGLFYVEPETSHTQFVIELPISQTSITGVDPTQTIADDKNKSA
jgi:C4-dicarboxylate-specific signal transduction histidine kinase